MTPLPAAGDQGGFLLSLVTESFAVRALLGSLAAAALAALLVRLRLVESPLARRLLMVAPVLTAAVAGIASVVDAEAYLPQLWVTTAAAAEGAAGQVLDVLWDVRAIDSPRRIDVLVMSYAAVVAALLLRRVAGMGAVRRALRRARPPVGCGALVSTVQRLALEVGVQTPRVVLLRKCPGGAFTAGTRRPVIALDPELLAGLDERETEGLLAHELSHIRRRDALVGAVVGVFRDVTFFLPPLHVAAHWLRREQEESADELASAHTGRPGALASSILKVWDTGHQRGLRTACAAVGTVALPRRASGSSRGAKVISDRVERILDGARVLTPWRRRGEAAVAAGVLGTAVAAALVVPSWMANEHDTAALAFAFLTVQPSESVESPAFATFRRLAPDREATAPVTSHSASGAELGMSSMAEGGTCPCVESQSQLRRRTAAQDTSTARQMLWRSGRQDPWELDGYQGASSVHAARPLLTLSDSGPQVGFFVLGSSS